MTSCSALCAASAAVLVLCPTALGSVITFAADASFIAYQNGGGFTKTSGANVRWGNGSENGDWEYAIVNSGDIPIGAVGNTAWGGTNAHAVTYTFDGSGNATLSLSGIGVISRVTPGTPSVLFARVRDSESPFSSLSSINIDLAYNGVGVDYSYSLLTGDADAEYWGVIDANMQLGFTLTANAVLAGPRSGGSDPMYQFKVGVPSPATATLLGLGGIALGRRRR